MSAVSVSVFRLIVAGAAARGVAPDALLRAAALSPGDLADSDGRLPSAAELRLWHEAVRLTGDDCLGLHLSEEMQIGDHGALGFAVRGSATVGDAYDRIARFLRVVVQGASLRIDLDGAAARIRHIPPPGGSMPSRHAVECFMGNLLQVARRGTGASITPREVRFRHAAPARIDEHRRLLGPVVRFSQDHDELVIDRAVLSMPQIQAEPALTEVLDRHLRELLARLPAEVGFLDRVRASVAAELQHGSEPTVEATAERLKMSPRTLQRRLQDEGTSYNALLGALRADLAVRYLGEERESISEIAFLLGFSEVSTFHRAFKRWTGLTPAAYRRGRLGSQRQA